MVSVDWGVEVVVVFEDLSLVSIMEDVDGVAVVVGVVVTESCKVSVSVLD